MRTKQLAGFLFLVTALCFAPGCRSSPAIAQQPRGHKEMEIRPGAPCTVVYERAAGADEIKHAEYLAQDATWIVVAQKGRRTFIPVRNVLRIDLDEK